MKIVLSVNNGYFMDGDGDGDGVAHGVSTSADVLEEVIVAQEGGNR